jgi:hypothetical protein
VSTKDTLLNDKVEGILFDGVESIKEVELECDGLHTSFTETLKEHRCEEDVVDDGVPFDEACLQCSWLVSTFAASLWAQFCKII